MPGEAGLSSGGRPNTARLQEWGAWLDELLAQVSDRPVQLLAHGSGAATVLSAPCSARVSGLVLLNPAGLIRPSTSSALLAAAACWRVRPGDTESRRLLGLLASPGALPPEHQEWLRLVGTHVKCSSSPPSPPVEVSARWRATRSVVAVGERDLVFPPQKLAVAARRVLHAEVVTMDGGHLLPYEHPARVVDLVHTQLRGSIRPAALADSNGRVRPTSVVRADRSAPRHPADR